ncbi:hypothetical protein AVEN_19431-1 [Araneus ventricosus]|uniref:Transposase Tc1-like domain-containing protein n=1 Tax=Araneus ventricosus TaxID=182803 RepID=A0A4Y2C6E5_ARAVE|nr:hypothetical protein AVEN_19431-1 [Araneus ventricosus]
MPLRRRRSRYQHLTEFGRGRVVGLREGGSSFCDIAERLDRNVSTAHDCCHQWSREGTASRRPGSEQSCGTTEREDRHVRRMAAAHRTASAAKIRAAVGITVTQRTVTYRLLQGQLRARRPVGCIPLTPNHCRLRHEWCQARAHWRAEGISVVFSDESRFCLGASDGRVLQEHPRVYPTHSDCKFVRQSGYSTCCTAIHEQHSRGQGGVFQQDNSRPNTAVVTRHALQTVDTLPWSARSPDLSPIEHVRDIIGGQLQRHPQPVITVPVLTDQAQQAWNSIPQTGIRHLHDSMYTRLHACIQNSGVYTGY